MFQPESDHRPPDWRGYLVAYDRAWHQFQVQPNQHQFAILSAGEEMLFHELRKPGRFDLGRLTITPGAQDVLIKTGHIPPEFLLRHKHGDWGELGPEDVTENERALREGTRLFSAYRTRREDTLWVITEWDWSVTTLLLPEDY